ncbi:MAG: hypothetical protein A2X48_11665 [Lentisphaerae bacterium GWF2_49_21]|nr:MAG: hypothetical protein A2X48_11665 [Lentisphaerae bacterium GWF2_49_21]
MSDSHTKKIWLLRHAQSKAQTEEEYGFDAGLSKKGEKQSERLRSPFKDIFFDKICLSPLKRARETFEISKIKGKSIEFDSRLIEDLPGGGYSSLLPYVGLPGYADADRHNAWMTDVRARALSFMNDLYMHDQRHILVVSHCGFFSNLLGAFLSHGDAGLFAKFKFCMMHNTGISVLYIGLERKADTLLCWNDIRHVHDLVDKDPIRPVPPEGQAKKQTIAGPVDFFRRKK